MEPTRTISQLVNEIRSEYLSEFCELNFNNIRLDCSSTLESWICDLIEKYAHWHFPDPENCNYPCEGVGYGIMHGAVSALESKGVTLYRYGGCAYARYPGDNEADFADYELSNAEDAAAMLVETMEYECDWSECFD